MKKIQYLLFSVLAIGLLTMIACKKKKTTDDGGDAAKQEQINLLTGGSEATWIPGTVTFGDADVTDDFFLSFTIKFSNDLTYTTQNSAGVFTDKGGTWDLSGTNYNVITLSEYPNNPLTVLQLTDTKLLFTIEGLEPPSNGKLKSVDNYEFDLVKQ